VKAVEICRGHQTGKLISAASGPRFTILWGHVEDILLLNNVADIKSVAGEIRRGIKEDRRRRKNKLQHENIMVYTIPQGDHN